MDEVLTTQKLHQALDAYNRGENDTALSLCRIVIESAPQRVDAWTLLGMALRKEKHLEAARDAYQRAINIDPSYADAHNNLANIYRELGRNEDAAQTALKAIALRPDWAEVHNALGGIYQALGQLDNAFRHFDKALALNPDNPDFHWDHSLCLLLAGRYKEGWDEYEWRWKRGIPAPRGFPQPEWHGEPLNGRRLLVYGEQGFGDALQFLRFVPMLKAYGGIIILEALQPLHDLISTSMQVDELVATGSPLPPFDCHIPLISLARVFGTTLQTIPQNIPYLTASQERKAHWRDKLATPHTKIGLVWAGNSNVKNDQWRSPRLKPVLPLLEKNGATFFALQKGDGRDDLKSQSMPANFIDLGDDIRDFADTAAILSQLDLLITTDTSVAHLAGAVGCKTWVMLHAAPDWRWLQARADSPWYPTLTLYRQPELGRWDKVVEQISRDMDGFLAVFENLNTPGKPHTCADPKQENAMEYGNGKALLDYFEHSDHRMIHKWTHYFEIYERHFAKFRGKQMSLLEFGVYHGGSLQMWKHYFGPQAKIYGVDIDPRCAALGEENITILLGNQEDRESLRGIKNALPKFDIIIDGSGNTMTQQITTFEEMYAHLNEGGIYLTEDMQTSYQPGCGGGYRNPHSFIEYSKNLIDQLNAWHSCEAGLAVNDFTRSAFSLHYYDGVLAIEKRQTSKPGTRMKGTPFFPLNADEQAIHSRG